jgi:thioredoxin 1
MTQTLIVEEEIRGSSAPVLVEFGAEWCPPCKAMAPVLADIAVQYADRLRVLTVDADAEPALTARYGVVGLPTLLVFRDGELVGRLVGARGKGRLTQELAELLGLS